MTFPAFTAKTKECAHCSREFVPARPLQAVCSPLCASRLVRARSAEKKAKDRAELRERKEKLKTRREWIAEAQAAVNRYVRLRDICAGRNCISCGAPYRLAGGGAFDAGHFRSVGSAPHLRFYLPQIRLQCVRCNRHLGGNVVEYRRRLVYVLGPKRVEQIEAMQGTAKWSVEYLQRLKRVMNKKANRLEKRIKDET